LTDSFFLLPDRRRQRKNAAFSFSGEYNAALQGSEDRRRGLLLRGPCCPARPVLMAEMKQRPIVLPLPKKIKAEKHSRRKQDG
jgi:hypothetical protein